MKNFKTIALLCFVLMLSCKEKSNSQVSNDIIEHVSVETFKSNIDNKKVQLIDVRTPEEYAEGFVKGAKNVNFYDDDFLAQLNSLDKSKPVYLYCKAGGRSAKAAAQLKEQGFTKIYDLQGGFSSWQQKEYPISIEE